MHEANALRFAVAFAAVSLILQTGTTGFAASPGPVLQTVFPAGGQAGQSVDVSVTGDNLQKLRTLRCNVPEFRCEPIGTNRFRLTIPAVTLPGMYDLWAESDQGISSPRTFYISHRAEQLEVEPNESPKEASPVPIDAVLNGVIDKGGDLDYFRFEARAGQRVVIECWAERIDSRLRAVLELFDMSGQRLAVNRGYFGPDPLIDFCVPADGSYVVRAGDLTSTGSVEHYYRLDIDTGPRVAFSEPAVVERGKATRVSLFGWNLAGRGPEQREVATGAAAAPNVIAVTRTDGGVPVSQSSPGVFDRLEVEIPASLAEPSWPLPIRLSPAQAVFEGFAYHLPGSHAAVGIGVTEVPVVSDSVENHTPASALLLSCPCEASGQLAADDERDWYAIQARRGEVLYIDALAQRIHSPADLDISVFDATGAQELAQFSDEERCIGGSQFPTRHLDPAGRWVAPADGRYLISARSLGGGLPSDPRRRYRLSVRREEPDFQLVAVPNADGPSGLNLTRGGREQLEVLAFRRRGLAGPIRIVARDLPAGVECPDVWLGPGVERGTIVVSADRNAPDQIGELKLEGLAEWFPLGGLRDSATAKVDLARGTVAANTGHQVRGGTVVRSGLPNGWGRLTSQIPLAVAGDSPLRITADGHEILDHHLYGKLQVRHSPGGIVDVVVQVERRDVEHQAPVKLIGTGLPESIQVPTSILPVGQSQGHLSFYLPPTLPLGRYSLVVRAETTVPTADKKITTVVVPSNSVTFEVHPAAFLVEVDPFAPTKAKRGDVLQVRYAAQRRNGFIGKMHTELAAPGRVTDVVGLRGRGETFVGQTDKGTLQIVVNDDAPLGLQPFLRLFTVGVLEDRPIYFGSSYLPLEISE